MDNPLELPVLSVEDAPGTALVLLPGLNMDRLEGASFEVDGDELRVSCRYGEQKTFDYRIRITEDNRETVESMERIAVMNPSAVEPRKLTSDPEQIKHLRRVMENVKSMTGVEPDALEDGAGQGPAKNGQDGAN